METCDDVLLAFLSLNGRLGDVEASFDERLTDEALSSDVKLVGDAEIHDEGKSNMLFDGGVFSGRVSCDCIPVDETLFTGIFSAAVLMAMDGILVSKEASLHKADLSKEAFFRDIFLSKEILLTSRALFTEEFLVNGSSLKVDETVSVSFGVVFSKVWSEGDVA